MESKLEKIIGILCEPRLNNSCFGCVKEADCEKRDALAAILAEPDTAATAAPDIEELVDFQRDALGEIEHLTARVKELEEFIGTIGPCGLAFSHACGCPLMKPAIALLAKEEK